MKSRWDGPSDESDERDNSVLNLCKLKAKRTSAL